ncbi:hypothetical protein PHMEG_00016685 [Phytophthora megakarya]|uniref:Uncharacterized protein n=1 Tax=Phytophthora megakarya TaxID=4795 RepID=A0A225VYE8_9STRA|nr:hypothetical protein PHMEG_00016685 [Phytophthora megakarya]
MRYLDVFIDGDLAVDKKQDCKTRSRAYYGMVEIQGDFERLASIDADRSSLLETIEAYSSSIVSTSSLDNLCSICGSSFAGLVPLTIQATTSMDLKKDGLHEPLLVKCG